MFNYFWPDSTVLDYSNYWKYITKKFFFYKYSYQRDLKIRKYNSNTLNNKVSY